MIAIKKARKLIQANPSDADSQIISALVLALESEGVISVPQLYQLDYPHFLLALEILAEWRLDRYYASKLRLLDLSAQVANLPKPDSQTDSSTRGR
ncbi:MAG: hypothetical protein PHH58_16930 [Rhodoferax sp.]|nr:hypothetical protein [Rhodoferax sp.]